MCFFQDALVTVPQYRAAGKYLNFTFTFHAIRKTNVEFYTKDFKKIQNNLIINVFMRVFLPLVGV